MPQGAAPLLIWVELLDVDHDAAAICLHRQSVGAVLVRDCAPFLVVEDLPYVLFKMARECGVAWRLTRTFHAWP